MEKDGADVDLDPAAAAMREYAQAGLDTFDMADHCELHAAHEPTWTFALAPTLATSTQADMNVP